MNDTQVRQAVQLHGLDLSYFTGKVEAYLRAKGMDYVLTQMDTRSFRRWGRITGVAQMPQLELPDGSWLTDSTHIMERLEAAGGLPVVYPSDPALCFVAHLLEDFADEWLWRPAMAYRWIFAPDALRAGHALAAGLMRDVPLPLRARRWLVTFRQRWRFVRGDGVNARTQAAVLAIYPDVLRRLQALLSQQPFILGQRPTQADFGFFGSMFRHFASDPTPAALMQAQAPAVAQWVSRLWQIQPAQFAGEPEATTLSKGVLPLLALVGRDYLPYLQANEQAHARGERFVHWRLNGVAMRTPVSAYRVQCLKELTRRRQALPPQAAEQIAQWMDAARLSEA